MEYPIPPERTDRLQGPEINDLVLIHSKYERYDGLIGRVTARSYVWGPGDPAYGGGARRYDWKVVEYRPGQSIVFDDKDLTVMTIGMRVTPNGK